MKDVTLNSSVDNLNGRLAIFKSDHMHQNQGRTFGPLFGLFLANLFARAVSAKYDPYLPFHLSYDPSQWLPYTKPPPNYNYHAYDAQWYPIQNPYNYEHQSYQNYPTLTTAVPYLNEQLTAEADYDFHYPEETDYRAITPNPSKFGELVAAESNVNARRRPTQRSKRRGPSRYSQKRRRTTTPTPDYYDSYEDYVTERYRRTRPPPIRQSLDSYEDDSYYGSFEATTKYYKKRRTTRKTNKNQKRKQQITTEDSFEVDDGRQTEIVIVRQAATTTTEPTTLITNSTNPTTGNSTATPGNNTYGYGPSNGNDHISFTYGPPVATYQYTLPYFDWYTQEDAKNAIVKRVRDIVTYDKEFNLK